MRPLGEPLDAIAKRFGLLQSRDKGLVAALRELSARYNDDERARVLTSDPRLHAARLHFSLVRDRPKASEALRELVFLGLLPRQGTVRLLDLGAGMGATSLGTLDALARAGFRGNVHCTLVEPDATALAIAAEVLRALAPPGIGVTVQKSARELDDFLAQPASTFDLIVLGQVLSEHAREHADRVSVHAALLERLCAKWLDLKGSLLVIEPALRTRARHLQQVRDVVRAQVFAPCPHVGACPALRKERDWCHEDRPIDLPSTLAPLARAAGLRFQGLTFSYLVLRRDGAALATTWETPTRLVSELRRSKGKSDGWFCAAESEGLALVECLDRDAKHSAWRGLCRGDVVSFGAQVPKRVVAAPAVLVSAAGAAPRGE